jgi:polyamine oxidase
MVCGSSGGLYEEKLVEKIIKRMEDVEESGSKLASTLHHSGQQDMSVMAMQRLNDQYVYNRSIVNNTMHLAFSVY